MPTVHAHRQIPVDVGAQSDLFGATAPTAASPSIAEQIGDSVRAAVQAIGNAL